MHMQRTSWQRHSFLFFRARARTQFVFRLAAVTSRPQFARQKRQDARTGCTHDEIWQMIASNVEQILADDQVMSVMSSKVWHMIK